MQRLQSAFPVTSNVQSYLTPCDSISLALTSTFFYKEGINYIAWKDKLHKAGCPAEILTAAHQTFAIKNYATLYKAFINYFKTTQNKNIELWEILILSGEPAAIEYAICCFNLSKNKRAINGLSIKKLAALSGKKGLKYVLERLNVCPSDSLVLIVAYRNSIIAMDYCLDHLKLNLNVCDKRKINALGYAALGNNPAMMKYLLNKQLKMSVNVAGNNYLHLAAHEGNIEVAHFAIHVMGIDPYSTNGSRENALLIAGKYGHFDFIIYLIAKENYLPFAQNKDAQQRTFLHFVCRQYNIDLINFAINSLKISFNSQDCHGAQAFHHASAAGNAKALQYLHTNTNTNFFATTKDGCNALHHASLADDVETIEFLIDEIGINIHSTDKKGLQPSHYAAIYGNTLVLKKLLDLGAKPTDTDFHGRNVTFFAQESKINKNKTLKILNEYKEPVQYNILAKQFI